MNHFFLLKLSIVLFTVGKTTTQNYTIERNFSNSHGDKFTIPKPLCSKIKSNDKCKGFGAETLQQTSCECQCPAFRPAFLNIGNDSRRCFDDDAFRKRQGCGIFVLQQTPDSNIPIFQGENFADQLQHISSEGDCKINVASSRFLRCDGTWAPISSTSNSRFEILKQSGEFLIMVRKTPNSPNIDGRIIRIVVTCAPQFPPTGFTRPCLLFKLHGKFECPVPVELRLSTTKKTVNITATEIASPTTKTGVGIKVEPTTVNVNFGKRESDTDSIIPIAFGFGVLGVIILVILCIVLVILINRHREKSEMERNYKRHSDEPAAHEEIRRAKQSDKETFGIEMYGNHSDRKSDKNNDAEVLLRFTKEKEAKEEKERHKTSMGEINESCDGDSAYDTIRKSDSPCTSEGVEFDHYSIPRKSSNEVQSTEEEVIEAEFRLSAEIPAVYDVRMPDSGSASNIPYLNKTPGKSAQPQNFLEVSDEVFTSSQVPITKVAPLCVTIDSTAQQPPYVPIVVLDTEATKSIESGYDTPEQVIDLQHVHRV